MSLPNSDLPQGKPVKFQPRNSNNSQPIAFDAYSTREQTLVDNINNAFANPEQISITREKDVVKSNSSGEINLAIYSAIGVQTGQAFEFHIHEYQDGSAKLGSILDSTAQDVKLNGELNPVAGVLLANINTLREMPLHDSAQAFASPPLSVDTLTVPDENVTTTETLLPLEGVADDLAAPQQQTDAELSPELLLPGAPKVKKVVTMADVESLNDRLYFRVNRARDKTHLLQQMQKLINEDSKVNGLSDEFYLTNAEMKKQFPSLANSHLNPDIDRLMIEMAETYDALSEAYAEIQSLDEEEIDESEKEIKITFEELSALTGEEKDKRLMLEDMLSKAEKTALDNDKNLKTTHFSNQVESLLSVIGDSWKGINTIEQEISRYKNIRKKESLPVHDFPDPDSLFDASIRAKEQPTHLTPSAELTASLNPDGKQKVKGVNTSAKANNSKKTKKSAKGKGKGKR